MHLRLIASFCSIGSSTASPLQHHLFPGSIITHRMQHHRLALKALSAMLSLACTITFDAGSTTHLSW
jgi:hypothetical protein